MFDEFKNAFQRANNGHVQLIIINVAIFLVMVLLFFVLRIAEQGQMYVIIEEQFTIPPQITDFIHRPWTIITYAFMHSLGDIWHIIFNMIALYWFGKLFVEYLGSDKVIALYLLGALAAGVVYLIFFNTIPFFKNHADFIGMVGASGAIYAIIVATATLLPNYTFFLMFVGPVKIKYIAAFFIVVSMIGAVSSNMGGNVAHLGGALMGFIYTKQLQAGVNWGGWITAVLGTVKGMFSPRAKVKVTYRKTETRKPTAATTFSKSTQSEIDSILDKISDRGYESLTKDEKEKLFNASKKP
jgi:membrane associated rhomboid family serine protease